MGTRFEFVVPGPESGAIKGVLEAAAAVVLELHERWSRFQPASLVSHINRAAWDAWVRVDPETWDLLKLSRRVWSESGKVFDPTTGQGKGFAGVMFHGADHAIRFTDRAVSLDFGAVAKGAALDAAAAVLREHGVTNALLHGGTSSVVAMGDDAGQPWVIRIGAWSGAPAIILRDRALGVSAASGRITDGEGHLVDPRTGKAAPLSAAACITAPTAALADAWSTVAAVAGRAALEGAPVEVEAAGPGDGGGPTWYVHGFERHIAGSKP